MKCHVEGCREESAHTFTVVPGKLSIELCDSCNARAGKIVKSNPALVDMFHQYMTASDELQEAIDSGDVVKMMVCTEKAIGAVNDLESKACQVLRMKWSN